MLERNTKNKLKKQEKQSELREMFKERCQFFERIRSEFIKGIWFCYMK